jgi:fluoroacetyl-CoA thioesterase
MTASIYERSGTCQAPVMAFPKGTSGEFSMPVTREVTVAHFHPEMPEVLGTPFLVYAMEVAAANALGPHLPPGHASVGVKVNVTHLAATPVGFTVTARAEVLEADERTVTFHVEAHDGVEKIGEGTHVRAVIDLERFTNRMQKKVHP